MARTNRPNLCTITWNPSEVNVIDLAMLASYIAEVDREVVRPFVSERFRSETRPLQVSYIMMASPLVIDIVASASDGAAGVLALGVFGFILRHPESIGGWIGRFRTSMYRNQREALIEKSDYLRTRAQLEARGEPIIRFERDVLPTLGRSPNQPGYRDDREF